MLSKSGLQPAIMSVPPSEGSTSLTTLSDEAVVEILGTTVAGCGNPEGFAISNPFDKFLSKAIAHSCNWWRVCFGVWSLVLMTWIEISFRSTNRKNDAIWHSSVWFSDYTCVPWPFPRPLSCLWTLDNAPALLHLLQQFQDRYCISQCVLFEPRDERLGVLKLLREVVFILLSFLSTPLCHSGLCCPYILLVCGHATFHNFPPLSLPHQCQVWPMKVASFFSPDFEAGHFFGWSSSLIFESLPSLFPPLPTCFLPPPPPFLFRLLSVESNLALSAIVFSSAVGAFQIPFSFIVTSSPLTLTRPTSIPLLLRGSPVGKAAMPWTLHHWPPHTLWTSWSAGRMSSGCARLVTGLGVWHIGWIFQCCCWRLKCRHPSSTTWFWFGLWLPWYPGGFADDYLEQCHSTTGCIVAFADAILATPNAFLLSGIRRE